MRSAIVFTIALAFASAQAPSAGSGPYAGPSVGAYALVANAAGKIVTDNKLKGRRVVIYDPQVFSLIPTYQTAVQQLRQTMKGVCPAAAPTEVFLVPSLDIGGAASGLAALLNAVTPAYAIQGQGLPFDNSALVAAFAKEAGANVIYPGYLLPAAKTRELACTQEDSSTSLADLWYGAAAAAAKLRTDIASLPDGQAKKDLQAKLDAYLKTAESYLAIDKGTSMLAKLLVVERLLRLIPADGLAVIDLKLDAVGMESVTRTWFGTRKTGFSCSVEAHYALLSLTRDGMELQKTDTVNIFLKVPNEDKSLTSVTLTGVVKPSKSK